MSRMRHVKGTAERLAASPLTASQPHSLRGNWQSIFPTPQPLSLEIGSGRGRFLYESAKAFPEKNYLGMDVSPEILMEAIDRYAKKADFPKNIRFLWLDAEHLDEIFAPEEVHDLYLHFSDPWPKNRHAKRRLTHPIFLDIYRYLLPTDGRLLFKTDSLPFYRYSLQQFKEGHWIIHDETEDLYARSLPDNIPTEYERRFVRQGLSICRLIASPGYLSI